MSARFPRYSARVIRTRRWQVLRHAILERDGWRCVTCGARRRLEVDHIKPVRTCPEGSFDPANLQTLCASCHTAKTRVEAGHPPAADGRRDWRRIVVALERDEDQHTERMDNA